MNEVSTLLASPIILEIYKDLLQPSIRTGGEALNRRVKKMFNDTDILPTDQQVEQANTQLSIPTLETLSYVNDEYLQNCFLKLLATSYDKDKQDIAHPAFPQILAQLSRDEAFLIADIKKGDKRVRRQYIFEEKYPKTKSQKIISNSFTTESLIFPDKLGIYLEHLMFLNIFTIDNNSTQSKQLEKVADDSIPASRLLIRGSDPDKKFYQYGSELEYAYTLSDFGKMFVEACIPDDLDIEKFDYLRKYQPKDQ